MRTENNQRKSNLPVARGDLKHSVRTRCPHCCEAVTVRLVLGDKDEAIVCPSCGGHVATMGQLLDATVEQVAAILLGGLSKRGGVDVRLPVWARKGLS